MSVVARHDALDTFVDHVRAGGSQGHDFGVVKTDALVQDEREPWRELPEQARGVKTHGMSDDLDDASVADFESVAERTMDDVATPVLGDAVDVGQLVDQAGGSEHPAGDHRVPADELDAEMSVAGAAHVDRASGKHLDAIAADLRSADRGQVRRWDSLMAEIAVHVCGRGVARLAGVDHDDRPALAGELQRRGEAGGRPTDDRDVAVTFHGGCGVFAHAYRRYDLARRTQGNLRYSQDLSTTSCARRHRWLN